MSVKKHDREPQGPDLPARVASADAGPVDNRAALALLTRWAHEASVGDEAKTWSRARRAIEENRLSSRRPFSD